MAEQQGVNPYQAPTPALNYQTALGLEPSGMVLADIGTRFAGAMVDGLLLAAVFVPGFIAMAISGDFGSGLGILAVALMAAGGIGYAALQWYLISTTGQSVAKRWLKMRIVRTDGAPVNFTHGVVLRSWVVSALSNIPIIGGIVALIDALMIFGQERRCLHDRIADTIVVKA